MRIPGRRSLFSLLLAATFASANQVPARAQTAPAAVTVQQDRIPAAADLTLRSVLTGHIPNWATSAADRGTIPDATQLQLILTLNRAPQLQAAFQQLLTDQQNPTSPRFHQWLTPQQIGQQFGPTQHDLDALTQWLTAQGLKVDQIQPSRIFVQVSGSSAIVSTAFQTSLHSFAAPAGTYTAPAAEPSIPTAFASVIASIGGLSDVPNHTHSTRRPDLPYACQRLPEAGLHQLR